MSEDIKKLESDIAELEKKLEAKIVARMQTRIGLEIKRMDLEYRKVLLETEAKDRRTDMIIALEPLSALLSGPIAKRMQRLGEQHAAAYRLT